MAGGAAERDVAECSLEARKLFPVLPEPPNKRAREDYVSSAWRAKAGTGWASKKKAAISATATSYVNPDCFEPDWQHKIKAWWRGLVSLLPSAC